MKLGTLLAVNAGTLALALPVTELSTNIKRAPIFQWFGSNEAGAEFGEKNLPGELGTDYIWPDTAAIGTLIESGMNIFRIAFKMERLFQGELSGEIDPTYLADLKATVEYVVGQNCYAVLDPHNYGRFHEEIITNTDDFAHFWSTVAAEFVDQELVIFDTNNEYHDMDQDLVLQLNQVAINSIREAGATTQYIFVEGNSWTGAWTYPDVNDNMKALTDPSNLIVYEMHQYLDEDGSGTHPECVSPTIGRERVTAATEWLRTNGKVGILGEFAGASNETNCRDAIVDMLQFMGENTDVWTGALWWAAGPWWADYMFSIEPPTGVAYTEMLPLIQPYF
ncbi:hypothetical protein AJ79_03546 [Helicocarpus griseus UAMH5409]|uniref:cellulase n=1 Tax=Helicocarpus griseus UAMH5409 TaxID=1447875 RepID=A0A2B7XXP0_9EURO|nr:hypothetical protein AJ79_03546 [Helicocarpus griseus UAMH5409]